MPSAIQSLHTQHIDTLYAEYRGNASFTKLQLSNMDVRMVGFYSSRLLWFRLPNSSSSPICTPDYFFTQFSDLLNLYYPHLFGTVVLTSEEQCIDLSPNKLHPIPFHVRKVDSSLSTVTALPSDDVCDSWIPARGVALKESLLACFLTLDDGFGFALSFNHQVVDGHGMAQFFVQFGEYVRTGGVKVVPVHERTTLLQATKGPLARQYEHPEYCIMTKQEQDAQVKSMLSIYLCSKMKTAVLQVSEQHYKAMRTYCGLKEGEFSRNDVLVGLLTKWVTEAREVQWQEGQQIKVTIAVNGRGRLKPDISPAFTGNAVFYATRSIDVSFLLRPAPEDSNSRREYFVHLFTLVRESVNRMTSDYLTSALHFIENAQPSKFDVQPSYDPFHQPDMDFTNASRFPFPLVDFGTGRPVRWARQAPVHPGVSIIDASTDEKGVMVYLGMFEDLQKRFMNKEEIVQFFGKESY
jgi:hypothetical protein